MLSEGLSLWRSSGPHRAVLVSRVAAAKLRKYPENLPHFTIYAGSERREKRSRRSHTVWGDMVPKWYGQSARTG